MLSVEIFNGRASVRYVIPGDPVPLARARHGNRRVWDSQKSIKINHGIYLANQHGDELQFSGPLQLDIEFYFVMPNVSDRKKQAIRGTYHGYKPDLSNLIKFVEDVATGILYKDDCTIALISAKKLYDDTPRTEFVIRELQR